MSPKKQKELINKAFLLIETASERFVVNDYSGALQRLDEAYTLLHEEAEAQSIKLCIIVHNWATWIERFQEALLP